MKVVVKRSKIHGKGLFAAKFIVEGDVIGWCETRATQGSGSGPYTLYLNEEAGKRVDVVCQFRFINHSDNPNVAYCDDLSIIALCNIPKGTELTHNYEGD